MGPQSRDPLCLVSRLTPPAAAPPPHVDVQKWVWLLLDFGPAQQKQQRTQEHHCLLARAETSETSLSESLTNNSKKKPELCEVSREARHRSPVSPPILRSFLQPLHTDLFIVNRVQAGQRTSCHQLPGWSPAIPAFSYKTRVASSCAGWDLLLPIKMRTARILPSQPVQEDCRELGVGQGGAAGVREVLLSSGEIGNRSPSFQPCLLSQFLKKEAHGSGGYFLQELGT